ncbi:cation diffusion facilitator family transporter [Sphingomonas sp. A2-49]|uniref:cation diffusion facilitator family transporter n=1 Tax=Sphingomonas sp. A2-49 TaxID=1391375 RepID=UPI0021D2EC8E|nr:cation diffusion facilitator family transporter [Sphingomonas sp. A2-49]MCU6453152.1 cation diffusion facilitator family transporter [Sphingomonas sp. A2-49]
MAMIPTVRWEERRRSRAALGVPALITLFSVLCVLLLKVVATYRTGSIAMLGSMTHAAIEVFGAILAVRVRLLAMAPADHDHRFGHGKVEALAALARVGLVTGAAVIILWSATRALAAHDYLRDVNFGISVSLVAIAWRQALHGLRRRGYGTSDHLGFALPLTDERFGLATILNLIVVATLTLDHYLHLRGVDAVAGVMIACWLAFRALRAASVAFDELMDKEWSDDKRTRFLAIAAEQHGIKGIHDFRTRRSGSRDFAQFHLEVDPSLSIVVAHRIVEAVEAALGARYPDTEVFIHLDPQGHIDTTFDLNEADVMPKRSSDTSR